MTVKHCKIIKRIFILLFIILISSSSYIIFSTYNIYKKINSHSIDINIDEVTENELKKYKSIDTITNIALFGIDSPEYDSGRCDSIMILTINNIDNIIKISSISRDCLVNVADYGWEKLNTTYTIGGYKTLLESLNENFGLNIDKFISVNFSTLPAIIDLIGGIDIEITENELDYIDGIDAVGFHSINGSQSLSYASIRDPIAGDYIRASRQRNIISSLYNKLITVSPSKLISLLKECFSYTQTNLTIKELLTLASTILSMSNATIVDAKFPMDGYYNLEKGDKTWFVNVDFENTKEHLRNFIFH